MQKKQWRWLFLLFVMLFFGCDEENPFNKPYVPPRMEPPPQKKLTVSRQSIGFVYVPVNKRDPFRPPHLAQTNLMDDTTKVKKKISQTPTVKREPKTELEKFELDQLNIVATVTAVANPLAMVEDPQGNGYIVRRGTLIGRNGGKVQRIYADGIIIEEESRDEAGRRIVNRVKIRIKEEKTEKTPGSIKVDGQKIQLP
jgi:type IV pilus assembly protein PilP